MADAERSGVNELFTRGVIGKLVGEERLQQESDLLGELLTHIHKDDGLAVYGPKPVQKAMVASAIETLLIVDEYLRSDKSADLLVEEAEKTGCKVVIFSIEDDFGVKLKGFGKVAALLRYKFE